MRGPANPYAITKRRNETSIGSPATLLMTVQAIANEYHVLDAIYVSFDGTVTVPGKLLEVKFGDSVVLQQDIVSEGPWPILLPGGLYNGIVNTVMTLTLEAAGTGGIVAKLSILYR